MRKIIYVLALVLCLFGCSGKYEGWKEIEMENIGNIKIPRGWTCHIKDDVIYFTDEGVTELTEDTAHLAGYIYEEKNPMAVYKMFDENATVEEHVKDEIFSNSTRRGIIRYVMNGKRCEKAYLKFYDVEQDKEIYMIVWDDSVVYEDLEKMAKSFERNAGEE